MKNDAKIRSDNKKPSVDTYFKLRFSGFAETKNGINKITIGRFFNISEIGENAVLKKKEKTTTTSHGINSTQTKNIIRDCIEIKF